MFRLQYHHPFKTCTITMFGNKIFVLISPYLKEGARNQGIYGVWNLIKKASASECFFQKLYFSSSPLSTHWWKDKQDNGSFHQNTSLICLIIILVHCASFICILSLLSTFTKLFDITYRKTLLITIRGYWGIICSNQGLSLCRIGFSSSTWGPTQ